jgi:lipid A 3-O-deacylase
MIKCEGLCGARGRAGVTKILILLTGILAATSMRAQDSGTTVSAKVLAERPWNLGVFGTGGFSAGYRDEELYDAPNLGDIRIAAPIELQVFNAGVHVGKILTKPKGPKLLRGQFELGVELLPYWQAHYPKQTLNYRLPGGGTVGAFAGSSNRYGMSATPFLCRWDFSGHGRVAPWLQLGGGLLWTNHKFPQFPDRYANTSVINFTPQTGIGANIFVEPPQSFFIAVNEVHISSASLGEQNPGINVTTQFSVGYSWWR